jgi:RNA recognition motif-containing protein
MGSKLYVGGLPYSITGDRLQEIFSAHGTVESANVISDKFTGQSRGFGFVEMSSGGEAQKAIESLNGTQLDGRTLTVNVRPSSCVPFRLSMAFCASPLEPISTKPKPRDWPVNLSDTTLADSTVPCSEKISCSRSPVTEYGKPPTYNLLPMFSSY